MGRWGSGRTSGENDLRDVFVHAVEVGQAVLVLVPDGSQTGRLHQPGVVAPYHADQLLDHDS